ncbi:hypothetical protein [Salipiger sp. D13]|nr:hypothetical protein [Salipiger sp. D13]
MQTIETLLAIADAYKRAAGVDHDSTVSHRVFGDSKKLGALRSGADITLRRFNEAMCWFEANWPAECELPLPAPFSPSPDTVAAAAE